MPASRTNYVVLYENESQVFGTASKKIALETPPPDGVDLSEKHVLFITYQPDNEILSVHPVPREEVLEAEIKYKAPKGCKCDPGETCDKCEGTNYAEMQMKKSKEQQSEKA